MQQAKVGLLSWCSSEWISCMIEQGFVQFSKQFTRIEKRTFGRARWSVLDDYFLFQNNYNKGKMGYIAVKIWLSPNSSQETRGYTITNTESTTENRASPCYAKKLKLTKQVLNFLRFLKELYEVGYTSYSDQKKFFFLFCVISSSSLQVWRSWCNTEPRHKQYKGAAWDCTSRELLDQRKWKAIAFHCTCSMDRQRTSPQLWKWGLLIEKLWFAFRTPVCTVCSLELEMGKQNSLSSQRFLRL